MDPIIAYVLGVLTTFVVVGVLAVVVYSAGVKRLRRTGLNSIVTRIEKSSPAQFQRPPVEEPDFDSTIYPVRPEITD